MPTYLGTQVASFFTAVVNTNGQINCVTCTYVCHFLIRAIIEAQKLPWAQ